MNAHPTTASLETLACDGAVLRELDHYTLIVPDADATRDFHRDVLGFEFLRTQCLDAGTAAPGEVDMKNHVLMLPAEPQRTVVITEGLTDDSIFSRYLSQHGPGIHHVAYRVDDLDATMQRMRAAGVVFTSDEVLRDPLSGLRQVFLDRAHAGYFIELIERGDETGDHEFTNSNMRRLACTMNDYVTEVPLTQEPTTEADDLVRQRIDRTPAEVREYLARVDNLPYWTCHKLVRRIGTRHIESRLAGDVEITAFASDEAVRYRFARDGQFLDYLFHLTAVGDGTELTIDLGPVPAERRKHLHRILTAEVRVLRARLEHTDEDLSLEHRRIVDYHLEVHTRDTL